MSRRKKWVLFLMMVFCLFSMSGSVLAASKPALSAAKVTLVVGNSKKLTMKGTTASVKWQSSKPSVASVDANGTVTALKKGSATITATVLKKKYTCKVTVNAAKLSASKLSVSTGSAKTLKIKNSKGKVTWSSADSSIAKVSSKGVVTGVKAGNAVISAKIGSSVYKCKVTVKDPDVATKSLTFKVSGGGEFVLNNSSAAIRFSMKKTAFHVTVSIVNSLGKSVYSETYDTCKASTVYTLNWTPSAQTATGSYRVLVKAGQKENYSSYLSLIKSGTFAGGNGSAKNPYLVATLAQFQAIELHNGCYYKQVNHINGNRQIISGIYSPDNVFNGCYDGNGYTISNLILQNSGKEEMALFGGVGASGTIENLTLSDIDVIGAYHMAAVLTLTNSGTLSNCSVKNSTINDTYNGYIESSFLCRTNEETGTISGCSVEKCTATLQSTNWSSIVYGAGLCVTNQGRLFDSTVNEMKIYSQLTTTGGNLPQSRLSGLVRWNKGYMQNCSAANASLDSSWAKHETTGGICQLNEGVIRNCSFSGTAKNEGVETNNGTVS